MSNKNSKNELFAVFKKVLTTQGAIPLLLLPAIDQPVLHITTMTITTNEAEPHAKRSKTNSTGMANDADDAGDDLQAKIVAAWKKDAGGDPEAAFAATVTLLSTQIDGLIKDGIAAFHQAEGGQNELAALQQEVARKDTEIANLRAAEEKNAAALSVRAEKNTNLFI